jgi:hypothetical protein
MFAAAGMLLLVIVLFIVLASIKKKPGMQTFPQVIQSAVPVAAVEPAPLRAYSMREQELNDFALLLAEEHRRLADETQRAAIRESLAVAEEYRALTEERNRQDLRTKVAAAFSVKAGKSV